MLPEEGESFVAFCVKVGNLPKPDKQGLLLGVDGGMHVGIEPARGVAVIAHMKFEPEIVAQRDGSVESAVVAGFPGQESDTKPDTYGERGGEPAPAVAP